MGMEHQFNLVYLTCHDFLFYASRDYGASARPVSIIGNYALMYAINRKNPRVRSVVTGTTPLYDKHLRLMEIYATPALPTVSDGIESHPQIGSENIEFESQLGMSRITWNSTGESLLWAMEAEKINIPKVGSYYKINPLAIFYFYTIGGPVPSVIRIGKKFVPARIKVEPLDVKEKKGRFRSTCPVNVADLPADTQILGGSLLTVPPSPLLLDAELEGAYIEGTDPKGQSHRIPVPLKERFAKSWSGE
jgi:CRISPR type I-D-associated protein Csc1